MRSGFVSATLLSLCRQRIKTGSCRSAWSWRSRSCSRRCGGRRRCPRWRLSWRRGWLRSPRCCSGSAGPGVRRGGRALQVAALGLRGWGWARGGPVPMLCHRAPAAQSRQERRRRGRAAPLRWEHSRSVRQSLLLCHPYVNLLRFVPCSVCLQDASAPSHCCSEFSQSATQNLSRIVLRRPRKIPFS